MRGGLIGMALLLTGGVGWASQQPTWPSDPLFREVQVETRVEEYPRRLRTLYRTAESLAELGDFEEALRYYDEALQLQRRHRDRRGMSVTLMAIGDTYLFRMGKPEQSLNAYAQALELKREVKDRKGEPEVLHQMAYAHYVMGQHEEAERLYRQVLDLARKVKNRRAEGNALNGLGNCLLARGQAPEALAMYEQALPVRKKAKDERGVANTTYNIGRAYMALGQAERAIEYFTKALALRRELLDVRAEAETHFDLARASAQVNRLEDAVRHFQEAAQLARRTRRPRLEVMALYAAGAIELNRERPEAAIALLRQALERARGNHDFRREHRLVLVSLGSAYFLAGKYTEAAHTYGEGVRAAHTEGDRFLLAELLFGLGQVQAAQANYRHALACYFHAQRLLPETNSPLAQAIERHVHKLREQLGDERFAEVEAEARAHSVNLLRELTGIELW
ncbi:MAG: tetratricopeptide repeat protein [Blastocatellia bacterium]|nr:tetratricopeptide repeat protein [Blastocatellia bacterium]MCS7158272.1 tetratricopeptide repeat protein [Blastocatellia bacterium]MCX7753110.1 tetratricopeptide repeat protein [Blastocatellia bacterium]MDW8169424.1 tetratricopeptide repeat protein [Acidobacteriota bacterium]MDW8255699.1 tetratricopeptide repeat protein [Acidobacteriota bacterium]